MRTCLILAFLEEHLPVALHGRLAGLHRQALLHEAADIEVVGVPHVDADDAHAAALPDGQLMRVRMGGSVGDSGARLLSRS